MGQKNDISERRSNKGWVPFNPYFVCNTSNCVTVRPVKDHLTPKMNIAFFIRNLMLNIFLFDNFFEKSRIFRENRKKLFWGRIRQFFREKRRLPPKINTTFFIINEVSHILLFTNFFQKCVIFWENARKPFLGPSLFWRKGGVGRRDRIHTFLREMRSGIFYRLTIFSKKAIFLETVGKKICADMTIF